MAHSLRVEKQTGREASVLPRAFAARMPLGCICIRHTPQTNKETHIDCSLKWSAVLSTSHFLLMHKVRRSVDGTLRGLAAKAGHFKRHML